MDDAGGMTEQRMEMLVSECFGELGRPAGAGPLRCVPTLWSCTADATCGPLTSLDMVAMDRAGNSGMRGAITQARVRPTWTQGLVTTSSTRPTFQMTPSLCPTPRASMSEVPTAAW